MRYLFPPAKQQLFQFQNDNHRDINIMITTADLCFYSGLERFRTKYEDRLINVGIAEQNMIGIAAGMAKEGLNVFATTYATFASTRCADQVTESCHILQFFHCHII